MPTLMIQGTTSDAGKSTLVAALCRVLARRGMSVAPFKPQNMALNSAVTSDGGEIGRAQALQAQACFVEPHTDMNPILLKPTTDVGAQVIIHGKAKGNMTATSYHEYKQVAIDAVLESHRRLEQQYDWIIVEGAGSPAEINLRDNDIANMGFAEAVDCPVVIVADIDKGGVFAHLVGTLDLLSSTEQARVTGFVVNRFRGDIALLQSGLDWLEDRTKKSVFGVLPYLHGLHLDAEDAISVDENTIHDSDKPRLKVVVPVVPRISNHTDFDPLRIHEKIEFIYVGPGDDIPPADLVILPGSKSVRSDMAWLMTQGWGDYLNRHLRYQGKVLGICGGYQMLGRLVDDPHGIEGDPGKSDGFAFLDCETTLDKEKILERGSGRLRFDEAQVEGYEIHLGQTVGPDTKRPFLIVDCEQETGKTDGAISEDKLVAGTYFHGLFDKAESLEAILNWAGAKSVKAIDLNDIRETQLNRLADAFEEAIDIDELISINKV